MKKVFIVEEHSNNLDLLEQFTHIRGYHGCRPLDIKNYYKRGIAVLSRQELLNETLSRLNCEYLNDNKIKEAFDRNFHIHSEDSLGVWFVIKESELIESAPHYMIYGSELIHSVASSLLSQELLKKKGIPTIFHLDIPLKDMDPFWLDCLKNDINEKNFNGGYKTNSGISPLNIVGKYHPSKLIDYHNNGTLYYSS